MFQFMQLLEQILGNFICVIRLIAFTESFGCGLFLPSLKMDANGAFQK